MYHPPDWPASSSASPLSTPPFSHAYSFSALRETVLYLQFLTRSCSLFPLYMMSPWLGTLVLHLIKKLELARPLLLQKLCLKSKSIQGAPPEYSLSWGHRAFWMTVFAGVVQVHTSSSIITPGVPFALNSILVWIINYLIRPVLSPSTSPW